MKRYRIHTPPYAPGQLVEDPDGHILKRDEVIEVLESALSALKRAANQPGGCSLYHRAELSDGIQAIESIVFNDQREVSEHV